MKRISLILASLVVLFGAKASAHVGGPFDNGDYSGLLDNSGVYQVAFRFSNGSGFAQFGNNVNPSLFVATSGATTVPSSTYSVLNRSIIYYKGMTYLGTCTGMVDHERKIVHGVTNGNSDVSSIATAAVVTPLGGVAVTSATTSLLNNGNVGFPCNTQFQCKITNSYPVLRFNGTGELSVINPSFAQTAFTEIAAGIAALPSPLGPAAGVPPTPAQIQEFATAIANFINTSEGLIPTTDQIRKNSDHVKMNVFGSRIFFTSFR